MLTSKEYQLLHRELDQPLAGVVALLLFKDENTANDLPKYEIIELEGRPTNYIEVRCEYDAGYKSLAGRDIQIEVKETLTLQQDSEHEEILAALRGIACKPTWSVPVVTYNEEDRIHYNSLDSNQTHGDILERLQQFIGQTTGENGIF